MFHFIAIFLTLASGPAPAIASASAPATQTAAPEGASATMASPATAPARVLASGLAPPPRRLTDDQSIEIPVTVPSSTSWTRAVLLTIMWFFIGALVLGPIVMYFRPEPQPESPSRSRRG